MKKDLVIVLAPDSFKESMTAKEVCVAMERGIKKVNSNIYEDLDITKGEVEIVVTAMFEGKIDQEKTYKLIINEVDENTIFLTLCSFITSNNICIP